MPHLRIDYSSNLGTAVAWPALFNELHAVLHEVAGVAVGNCKSRAYRAERYLIGSGQPTEAFMHLDLRLLEGRAPEVLDQLGQQALACLERHGCSEARPQPMQLTVAVGELAGANYFKRTVGA